MSTPEPNPYRKLNYPIVNLEQSFTLAEKLQGLANLGVPSSVNKAGKVLTVGDSTGELEWANVSGGGLPGSTSADEGKVLTVDSNGDPQWAPPSGGGGGDVTDVTVNGTSVVTNHVAEVTVPTKTSDLTNDSGFITSAALPTVNDGTLTIQKNGTTIDTFTANSSSNKTVDISVPTKTSDLTNDSGFITSSDIPATPVSDVQVDGVSVVSSGVANITLPTVNDGTLTIQKNGTTIDTFTANSSANKTVDITVPTKTSDLTNDSGFITSASLPTVNDATLTIQKNGTTVDTFTANASSNKTVNITVPTKTSDITNDSGFITSSDIPAQVQSDWTENDNTDPAYIQNKPQTAPIVAGTNITITDTQNGIEISASGSAVQVNADWNAVSGPAEILHKPTIPTNTSDLTNDSGFITAADIPAQVNADWNAVSGPAEILHKPTIPTVPTTDQTYNASSTNPQSGTAVAGAIANINQVPASTSADENKVLTVNSQGTPEWANTQLPAQKSLVEGTGIDIVEGTTTVTISVENPVPALTNNASKILAVNSGATGMEWIAQPTIPTVDQTYSSSSTNPQSGTAVAGAIANVRQVPSSTQADANKVLTVNAQGTPEWATPTSVTLSTLNTAGITDIQQVNALPVSPVATVLYLIPET